MGLRTNRSKNTLQAEIDELYAKIYAGGSGNSPNTAFVNVHVFGAQGNGVHDDTAAIQAGVNALAGTGKALWFPKGTYVVTAPVNLPVGGLIIWGSPEANIAANVPGASIVDSTFYATAPAAVTTTTVATSNGVDANSFVVTSAAGFAVGDYLQLVDANMTWTGIVDNIAGTTITVDRSITHVFAPGATVNILASQPVQLWLHGNGMQFSGTAVGHITGCFWGSLIEGVVMSGSSGGLHGDVFVALNYGSALSVVRNSRGDATGHGAAFNAGFALVGTDRCAAQSCEFSNGGTNCTAFKLSDATNSLLVDCEGCGCNYGAAFSTDSASTLGSVNCRISGGVFSANATDGIVVSNGSAGNLIEGVKCSANAGVGIHLNGSGGGNMVGNTLSDVICSNNGAPGIQEDVGTKRTRIDSAITDLNTGGGILTATTDLTTIGYHECNNINLAVACLSLTGTGRVIVDELDYLLPAGGAATFCVTATAAGRIDIRSGEIILNTNSIAIDAAAAGALIACENLVIGILGGAGGTSGFYGVAGGAVQIGPLCDATATATPVNMGGGATFTMTQSGGYASIPGTATPVNLPFLLNYITDLELAAGATGDTTVVIHDPIPGLQFACLNFSAHNMSVKTPAGATVVVAAGKTRLIGVDGAGDCVGIGAST